MAGDEWLSGLVCVGRAKSERGDSVRRRERASCMKDKISVKAEFYPFDCKILQLARFTLNKHGKI